MATVSFESGQPNLALEHSSANSSSRHVYSSPQRTYETRPESAKCREIGSKAPGIASRFFPTRVSIAPCDYAPHNNVGYSSIDAPRGKLILND